MENVLPSHVQCKGLIACNANLTLLYNWTKTLVGGSNCHDSHLNVYLLTPHANISLGELG